MHVGAHCSRSSQRFHNFRVSFIFPLWNQWICSVAVNQLWQKLWMCLHSYWHRSEKEKWIVTLEPPKITHKSYTQVCKRPLLFTVFFFFSQKIRCLSGVFVKILKASKTFRIDYPICVSYVKLCCVKQNICLVCLEQFRSYRMKAWQLSFKLLSVLLHWMWGELWKE